MIAQLEKEAEAGVAEKAYCVEEMGKTEAKKSELEDEIEKFDIKIDENAAKSRWTSAAVEHGTGLDE